MAANTTLTPANVTVVAGPIVLGGTGNGSNHTHPTSAIIGLDGKLSVLTSADAAINANLAGKANKTHNHPTSDILGLDGTIANITAGKANITHNHTASDITGLDIYIPKPATATANQVLTYNGTLWTAANAPTGGGGSGTYQPALANIAYESGRVLAGISTAYSTAGEFNNSTVGTNLVTLFQGVYSNPAVNNQWHAGAYGTSTTTGNMTSAAYVRTSRSTAGLYTQCGTLSATGTYPTACVTLSNNEFQATVSPRTTVNTEGARKLTYVPSYNFFGLTGQAMQSLDQVTSSNGTCSVYLSGNATHYYHGRLLGKSVSDTYLQPIQDGNSILVRSESDARYQSVLPTNATANQVLTFDGAAWKAANAPAVGTSLPAGTVAGELMTFNGAVWVGTGAAFTNLHADVTSTHYTNRVGQGYICDDSGLQRVGILDPGRYADATFLTLADCNKRYLPTPTTPATANQVLTYDGVNWVAANTVSAYVLPVANLTTLGGVKQGANVTIDPTGLLSVNLPAAANLTGYIPKPATATANQILTYNGTMWNAANAPTTGLTQSQADLLYQPLGGGLQTLTDAANVSWPLDPAKLASLTLGGTRTLSNPTNKAAGGVYLLIVKQNATGGFALNFGTEYKFPSGIKPIIPTTANAVTILTFVSDGVNMYGLQQGDFK